MPGAGNPPPPAASPSAGGRPREDRPPPNDPGRPQRADGDGAPAGRGNPPPAAGPPEVVRYVVVVHGMGEAREKETTLGVVSRFAEARRGWTTAGDYDVVTLGNAVGQSGVYPEIKDERGGGGDGLSPGCPWLEFRGIPKVGEPDADSSAASDLRRPFLGKPSNDGESLRFVDCHWSDITANAYEAVGQSPGKWAAGLLGRLERKDASARSDRDRQRRVPAWALHVLRLIEETLVLLHRIFALRAPALDETVFVKYLGDVQVYGECAPVRGRAVRRFHRLMRRVQLRHEYEEDHAAALAECRKETYQRREARYTILAHSLGTVMALDALLLAHASPLAKFGTNRVLANSLGSAHLPFPGYLPPSVTVSDLNNVQCITKWLRQRTVSGGRLRLASATARGIAEFLADEEKAYLVTDWATRVDSLVTLGSPIDKFLVLWWQNYRFLAEPDSWLDADLAAHRETTKIRHFNYSDEQDPVGHRLDVARSSATIRRLFDSEEDGEDLVYNRCAIPGLAHVSYWRDLPLLARILRLAVDGEAIPRSPGPAPDFVARPWHLLRRDNDEEKDQGVKTASGLSAHLGGAPEPAGGSKGDSEQQGFAVYEKSVYRRILAITYKLVPYTLILAATALFVHALLAETAWGRIVGTLIFLLVVALGRRLLDLLVWWRAVLRNKDGGGERDGSLRALGRVRWAFVAAVPVSVAGSLVLPAASVGRCVAAACGLAALVLATVWPWILERSTEAGRELVSGALGRGVLDVTGRRVQQWAFRQDLGITQLLALLAFAIALGCYGTVWGGSGIVLGLLAILLVAVVGFVAWRLLRSLLFRRRGEEGSSTVGPASAEHPGLVMSALVLPLTAVAIAAVYGARRLVPELSQLDALSEWIEGTPLSLVTRNPWIVENAASLCLGVVAATALSAVAFGYVRYRLWQIRYLMSGDPTGRSRLLHLLPFLPEPWVRWLARRRGRPAGPPAVESVEYDRYSRD